jgi:hypothetical protein
VIEFQPFSINGIAKGCLVCFFRFVIATLMILLDYVRAFPNRGKLGWGRDIPVYIFNSPKDQLSFHKKSFCTLSSNRHCKLVVGIVEFTLVPLTTSLLRLPNQPCLLPHTCPHLVIVLALELFVRLELWYVENLNLITNNNG